MSPPLFRQQALDVVFLHWPVPPEQVRDLLPPGVEPDMLGDTTYVGLVAVRNAGIRPLGLPPAPRVSAFPQVNVRLYGRDRHGRRGVVFLSMEAARSLPASVGRWVLGLPYTWQPVQFARRGDVVEYSPRVAARVGRPVQADPFAAFVTSPPGLFMARGGRSLWIANEHPPWPLRQAELVHVRPPAGTVVPDGPPRSVLYSPGVPMTLRRPAVLHRR